MNEQPQPLLRFSLQMTTNQAIMAASILSSMGIAFDPAESLLELDPDEDAYWTMQGRDLEHLLVEINSHLREHHPGCRVPDPVTLEQRAEALRLAYWEFEWRRRSPAEDLWTHDGGAWADLTKRYPALFQQ